MIQTLDGVAPRRASWFRNFASQEPRFFWTGTLIWAATLPTAALMLMDPRTIHGVSVWEKPLKFQFAFGLYLLSLVVFAHLVPHATKQRRWYRRFSQVVALSAIAEIGWTAGASTLGVKSHFNGSGTGTAIYALMGVAAIVIISASTIYAIQIARNGALTLPPVVIHGIVLGLALTGPLTLVTAGTMVDGHWVGGARSDANGLGLMGWARDGGDLRVAHFFATHALHVVPAFALVSAALFGGTRKWPVWVFAALFSGFTLWTFAQAHSGRPFMSFVG